MELFTEDELATVVEQLAFESIFIRDSISRLVEHARELIRLKSSSMAEMQAQIEMYNAQHRIHGPKPRESDFWHGTVDKAGEVEANMRAIGFECVSSIPMLGKSDFNGYAMYVHMHFRKL